VISSEQAEDWMFMHGFDNPAIKQAHIDRFMETPNCASHMFVAMLIISKCAETPQNLADIYGAVRDVARVMKPKIELQISKSTVDII
jgi:hypothetical protein